MSARFDSGAPILLERLGDDAFRSGRRGGVQPRTLTGIAIQDRVEDHRRRSSTAETAARPSPSRRARRRTRRGRCGRPLPCRAPARETCRPRCPSAVPDRHCSLGLAWSRRPGSRRRAANAWPARSRESWPDRACDEDVRRLEVAVDDALRRARRRARRRSASPGRAPRRAGIGPRVNAVLQRLALEQLHRDERPAVVVADVVNGADVRVVQRRGGARLRAGIARAPAGRSPLVGQELQGNGAGPAACPRPGRRRPCRHRRAASDDAVVRDGAANHPGCREYYTGRTARAGQARAPSARV